MIIIITAFFLVLNLIRFYLPYLLSLRLFFDLYAFIFPLLFISSCCLPITLYVDSSHPLSCLFRNKKYPRFRSHGYGMGRIRNGCVPLSPCVCVCFFFHLSLSPYFFLFAFSVSSPSCFPRT